MEILKINGRRATNRAGAAEYLGRSLQWVQLEASPKQRAAGSGWPQPIPHSDEQGNGRQQWYALDDLDRYRTDHLIPREQGMQARVHEASLEGRDPEQLITALQFREMIDVTTNGWTKYVDMSKNAWAQGSDGYLPLPDDEEPAARRGVTRYWKLHRVIDWINARPGKIRGGAPTKT